MGQQIPDLPATTTLEIPDQLLVYKASAGTLANISGTDVGSSIGDLMPAYSLPAGKIDYGGAGVGVWWEEIARTTLASVNDTITVSSIPNRKYLMFIFYGNASGGTLDTTVRFNNDSGANYALTYSSNYAAPTASTSQTSIPFDSGATDSGGIVTGEMTLIANITAEEKNATWNSVSQDAAGAGTNAAQLNGFVKWANTSAVLSRIDWINSGGTGDFAVGSEVIVLGHN